MKKFAFVLVSFFAGLSAFAASETQINAQTVQGTYQMKAQDIYMEAEVTLVDGKASMTFHESAGSGKCKGTYEIIEANKMIVTHFNKCAFSTISHVIYMGDETIETLLDGTSVDVTISVNGETSPKLPFAIKKIK